MATGIELAWQIAELAHGARKRNFRRIDPKAARILPLNAAPTMLATFPESLQRSAARRLKRTGVEIHLSAIVTASTSGGSTPTPAIPPS